MPASESLIDLIANAIAEVDDKGLTNMTWNLHAYAALHAVATWINEREIRELENPAVFEAPTSDEVVGWLQSELERNPHA
jgi:hypothetical protein